MSAHKVIKGQNKITMGTAFSLVWLILAPEKQYMVLAMVYGVAISLLTLAVPISVQMLIDTVANTAMIRPVIVLSVVLFILLLISGVLTAARIHVMEMFGRRIYARLTGDIALQSVHAKAAFFDGTDRADLINRYFDIMTLQRRVPLVLSGAFAIFLQSIIGFIVVSLYHPALLAFNIALIVLLTLTALLWGPRAIRRVIELSHAKYNTGACLQGIVAAGDFFKSSRHVDYVYNRVEQQTSNYIDASIRFFGPSFGQSLALLLLYALSSATLLGLGGVLVIEGQLTLGQLVAAELIMSAIFVGIAQFTSYLEAIYDIFAACEELSLVYGIPHQRARERTELDAGGEELCFHDVTMPGTSKQLSLRLPGGSISSLVMEKSADRRRIINYLKGYQQPEQGHITLGGHDLREFDSHDLRDRIVVIDRQSLIQCRIIDLLKLAAPEADRADFWDMLQITGVDKVIRQLPDGLDTWLTSRGRPLSGFDTMRLKLTAAMLAGAKVIVLPELDDLLSDEDYENIVSYLRTRGDISLVCLTQRRRNIDFDEVMDVDAYKSEAAQ